MDLLDKSLELIAARASSIKTLLNQARRADNEASHTLSDKFKFLISSEENLLLIENLINLDESSNWLSILKDLISHSSIISPINKVDNFFSDRCLTPDNPYPFEEIFLPFVRYFRDQITLRLGGNISLLSKTSQIYLERRLIHLLSHWALLPLFLEFRLSFPESKEPSKVKNKTAQKSLAKDHYLSFVNNMLNKKLISFFEEYSVLARLLCTLTENAINSTVEFIDRFALDSEEIGKIFSIEVSSVKTLELGLSDPHFDGRTVIILTLDSDFKLVYKPKNVSVEYCFSNLLTWVNSQSNTTRLYPVTVLDKNTHGWVEFIKHDDSANYSSQTDYFYNTGKLLCLIYLLRGSDLHYENVISTIYHPVLIDLEVLFSNSPKNLKQDSVTNPLTNPVIKINETVIKTGLLPTWQKIADEEIYDISGLCASEYESEFPWYYVEKINTDEMHVGFRRVKVTTLPKSNKNTADISQKSREEIKKGFAEVYDLICNNKFEVLSPKGKFNAFSNSPVRFVFRPTRLYGRIFQRLTQPNCLRNSLEFAKELNIFFNILEDTKRKNLKAFEDIVESEIEAFDKLDFPHFGFTPKRRALISGSKLVSKKFFPYSGWNYVSDRLTSMNETDKKTQIAVIDASFYARFESQLSISNSGLTEKENSFTDEEFQTVCFDVLHDIGNEVSEQAIFYPDDSVIWITLLNDQISKAVTVSSTDYTLYNGQVGIALFFASLHSRFPDTEYEKIVTGILKSLLNRLEKTKKNLWNSCGIGFNGLGGILFSMVLIDRYFENPYSKQIIKIITNQCHKININNDKVYDVIGGAAGAILGLNSYFQRSKDTSIFPIIKRLANHLVFSRIQTANHYKAWQTISIHPPLNGFAHGSSGISFSLLTADNILGNSKFGEVIKDSVLFENSTFNNEVNTWLDLRTEENENVKYSSSWCHGSTGIGLSRLALFLNLKEKTDFRNDVDKTLNFILTDKSKRADCLCCGEIGIIDFLIECSIVFKDKKLMQIAKQKMMELLLRYKKNKGFNLFTGNTKVSLNPSLFQGSTGIGYGILRILYPMDYSTLLLGGGSVNHIS